MTKHSQTHDRRQGAAGFFVLVGLVFVMALGAGVWYLVDQASVPEVIEVIAFTVVKDDFEHVVNEQGEVESSGKIEVKCEVDSPTSGGTEILWIIEEGTYVKGPRKVTSSGSETIEELAQEHNVSVDALQKLNPSLEELIQQKKEIVIPGDLLVTLNKKSLQDARDAQNKAVVSAQSTVTAAENKVTQATISLEEYLKGTFLQDKQIIESEILVAQERLARAKDTAQFSSRLAALGFLTAEQLKADLFAVKQTEVDLALVEGRMDTLKNITKKKMEVGFQSDIKAAQAELNAKQAILEQEQTKLDEVDLNLGKCDIYAPATGQVLYHNQYSSRSGRAEVVIEAGTRVRERQTVIDLPNPTRMQVKAKINEGGIRYVRTDQDAIVKIGALEDDVIRGRVSKVNQIPIPTAAWGNQVKEYATLIEILDPPETIRSGMTAEVKILVERLENVLVLPVQALHEVAGHYFCLVHNGDGVFETREIKIGSSNEKMVVIDEAATKAADLTGIRENETVVENLRAHEARLDIPNNLKDIQLKSIGKKGTTVEAPKEQPGRPTGSPSDTSGRPRGNSGGGGGMLARLDKNGDGKLSPDEMPEAMPSEVFTTLDTNKDGFIDKKEAAAFSGNGRPGGGRPGGGR